MHCAINTSQHEISLNRVLKISSYITENNFLPTYKDQSPKLTTIQLLSVTRTVWAQKSKSVGKMQVSRDLREIKEGRLMWRQWQSVRLMPKTTGGQFQFWDLKKIDSNCRVTQVQQWTSAVNKILTIFYKLLLNKVKTKINKQ